jgi:hypothetical protein
MPWTEAEWRILIGLPGRNVLLSSSGPLTRGRRLLGRATFVQAEMRLRRPRTASKSVKLQRRDKGRRVQSLLNEGQGRRSP